MKNRVVITGLGVVAPNGIGVSQFSEAIQSGTSGIRHFSELEELGFRCQVGGKPEISEEVLDENFDALERKRLKAEGVLYGAIAGLEAWQDAGFEITTEKSLEPLWKVGCIFGGGLSAVNVLREAIYKTDDHLVKKLGTTAVEQTMPSGISAFLGGKLGLGNQVSTNAAACSTGTESILMAFERIQNGQAEIMLAGSCDAGGPYVWGGFDAMRVLNSKQNDAPENASRPMSETAAGFVPGCGAGALVLENYDNAKKRGAKIYGEILGGAVNSGGQRGNGSMTAPNPIGVQKCIEMALQNTGIQSGKIDLISGHLTATMGDSVEIENWVAALNRHGKDFPKINSLKGMTGHCLSAAGSIESVAAVLQLSQNFIHPNVNCEDLHPKIAEMIDENCVPRRLETRGLSIIAKSSFGFGDVNSVLIFKKLQE